ncbi:MAG TPA: hypothetical protein DHW71_08365 [Gammaproteobacteria bacterium]|nr:hypothetical protein [Gammaproteobacteria bacterium]HBF08839.1 hypothetical protein [Gammaproteobacteria bacterium]HCK92986.1 hypothetical protein [Gammaproteobacteria bacterium]|tara:strand:+ start:6821 stop:7477 length:657 start_codon:yes stop_codon:yes gene_type:complete
MSKAANILYPHSNPVFVIGASAGGVKALQVIAENLPKDFPAAVFFVLHRKRMINTPKSTLHSILVNKSHLKVTVPEDGDPVRAGHIYLPTDDKHIRIHDNRIILSTEPSDEVWRPSINSLFRSAAREYMKNAIGILLTGKLNDGVEGLREITYNGGITVAQSPDDAKEPEMPFFAILNDHPSYVLPLADIPKLMCELAGFKAFSDQLSVAQKAFCQAF